MDKISGIWVYLAASPLLWLLLTLVGYLAGQWLFRRSGGQPLFNPVALAIMLLVTVLLLTGTPYATCHLFCRGAVYSFPAWPGYGGAGDSAVPAPGESSATAAADQRWFARRFDHRDPVGHECGVAVRRIAAYPAITGPEIGDDSGGDGHCRENRWTTVVDRGDGHSDRGGRRGGRPDPVRLVADPR